MRFIGTLILAPVMALALTGATFAAEVQYSYATPGTTTRAWGSSTAERYSIAISIPGDVCQGLKVKSVTIPLRVSNGITQPTVWLSTELAISGGANMPNLGEWPVTIADDATEDTFVNVTFTIPDDITIGSGGLYAGYSFTVGTASTAATQMPVEVSPIGPRDGGLWMFATRSNRAQWSNRSADAGGVSTMSVMLEGQVAENSAEVVAAGAYFAAVGEPRALQVTVMNRGANPVETIDYTLTIGSDSHTGTATLTPATSATLGSSSTAWLTAPDVTEKGNHRMSLTVNGVNGHTDAPASVTAELPVALLLPFLPVNRPLADESTGTTCGNCPRGIAGIEEMNRRYPDDFLALSWHVYSQGDPMYPAGGAPENLFDRFAPVMFLNRWQKIDPYHGLGEEGFGLDKVWEECRSSLAPMEVELTALWAEDDPEAIDVETHVNWATTQGFATEGFLIDYILVGDGIKGTGAEWIQYNGLSSFPASMADTEPLLAPYILGPDYIDDMEYNDVGLLWVGGAEPEYDAYLPPAVPEEPVKFTYRIDTRKAVNAKGERIPFDRDKLKVIAFVVYDGYNYGTVMNANRAKVGDPNGSYNSLESLDSPAESVRCDRYDLQGRPVTADYRGLVIRIDTMSDGTRRTSKELLR